MDIIHPPHLKKGDNIGIAAPAGHFDSDKFNAGVNIIKEMGFKVTIPEDIFLKKRYFAGSDQHRAKLINALFSDPTINAIACARGGFGSLRVLSYLNYDSIKKNPKILIGFSDITALLLTINERCGFVTYHGPVLTSLGLSSEKSHISMYSVLSNKKQKKFEIENNHIIKSGKAEGVISGGNLSTICHMTGTPFQPDFNDKIIFFEDVNEPLYKIDRMLSQMKLAGCFNGIKGIVLGTFENCSTKEEINKVIIEIFDEFKIPVISGLKIGHGKENLTIPIGNRAFFDTDTNELIL